MNDVKTPKILILMVILALAGTVVIAGCGGSGGTTATGQGRPAGSNTPEVTPETEAAEEAAEEAASAEAAEEESAAEEPAEEEESGAAASEEGGSEAEAGSTALAEEGKTVFTTNCGVCHTLSEAGTSGTVGPNLDELKPSEPTVEHQVINGGGPMPAFGKDGILSPEEVKAVATYVSSVAGTE